MSTHDNAPPPADWVQPTGFTCGGCGASANLCRVLLAEPVNEPCCRLCTHEAAAVTTEPLTWEGDGA